ncbi:NAD(P)H-quinone oxidoreductase [Aeromicrobium chenweiae]|uniref:NADPH:quinone oxidoreductase n=1 Tax=Aeromicrobium chenweiae TaxID=2079793 RepID=A0A2S0WPL0_9ACTN|nr:NAD(P)H-quinone oxidoreductase [Aeromicrobium chenweiae]AWB93232.1 NADPH:quinone oxidoreductase [Aeromicrobium chenweiae]TGN34225.1 NAD(P)H-quinone oxidoreductase [Aeromicrobium chenweiae]
MPLVRGIGIRDGQLELIRVPDPRAEDGEVVIEIVAAGVNRADTSQRRGRYDPPAGSSPLPGLECSGRIVEIGRGVTRWQVGDEVCALLAGGGYAEKVAVPAGQVFEVPRGVGLVEAAAVPEAAATVWSNLITLGGLSAGETVLVHGGSSGIGTMAIQVARLVGAEVIATAGSPAKLEACASLGARAVIDHRREDFVQRVLSETDGRGVDVVLDIVGADYLQRNVDALAVEGRLVVVGIQSGFDASVDLRSVLRKRVRLTGSMLRSRPVVEKAAIIDQVVEHVVPALETGAIKPVIETTFPLDDAAAAHRLIESSQHIGKILLTTT